MCASLIVFSGWAAAAPAPVQPREYEIAPRPAWVNAVDIGAVDDALLGQISNGIFYRLSDTQMRVSSADKDVFRHFASKAINAKGVESVANVEIVFDPSYQHLTLHAIDVIRDGQVTHRLSGAAVRILQRETELEYRIYDGSKTASIFLDDVRVGDTVEYSYSLRGRNPVFNGGIFGGADLQFAVPVGRIYSRALLPIDDRISISTRNMAQQPATSEHDGFRDHVWDLKNVPALISETGAPSWYDPYPLAQWSGYADWAAVVEWATPLYRVPPDLSPELAHEIYRIATSASAPQDRLLAALRLVQTEIRYLGVEIGPGSHAPNPPSLVFARRFGDCKDKTLLLLSMLDRLGVEAHAALVNTRMRRGLLKSLPGASLFDHVLVYARIGQQGYWVDPTRPTQEADLADLYQPDYDVALVVDPATKSLQSMKPASIPVPKTNVRATFDGRAGFLKPISLTVVSTVEGDEAESRRRQLSSSNQGEEQKRYLNYYARYYPGISVAAPLVFADDKKRNRFTTTETYAVADFATWSEESKQHVLDFSLPDLDELLRSPETTVRKAPLKMSYPSDVTLVTDLLLDRPFRLKPHSYKVEDPAFLFERSVVVEERRAVITDHYQSRVDSIAATDVARFAANLARARDVSGYKLYWSDADKSAETPWFERINWLVAMLAVMSALMWSWLARLVYRYDPPERDVTIDRSLQGIRGWLLMPALGAVVTPFAQIASLFASAGAWSTQTWLALTSHGAPAYHAMWAPILLYELVGNLGLLVFSVLLCVLFFRRRQSLPTVYIAFLVAGFAEVLIDHLLAGMLPAGLFDRRSLDATLARMVPGSIIWIIYFLRSKRVQSTFVVRYRPPAAEKVERRSESLSGEIASVTESP